MNIKNSKRLVVKVGSALVTKKDGTINKEWLDAFSQGIAKLRDNGTDVVVVSSGAVSLGRKSIGITKSKNNMRLEQKQAAAACGQVLLVEEYRKTFTKHDINIGQVLLTIEDSENRRRYLNARSTFQTLLEARIIPIVNENDTVATEEIRVGDNDRLAARVAQMIEADFLVLFSDVDGLYTSNPMVNKKAKHIPIVEKIDDKIMAMAGGAVSQESSGGMATKVEAARIATRSGCNTIITAGKGMNPVEDLLNGCKHTIFIAKGNPGSARKKWIGDTLIITGEVVVDDGAAKALSKGKSLLPAGVTEVRGNFERGDAVLVVSAIGEEIGRGLVAYSKADAERIIGHNSSDIEKILGYSGRDALIHRNDLVLSN